jgi:hypothetical protein
MKILLSDKNFKAIFIKMSQQENMCTSKTILKTESIGREI